MSDDRTVIEKADSAFNARDIEGARRRRPGPQRLPSVSMSPFRALLLGLFVCACGTRAAPEPITRLLGMDVNAAADGDYGAALTLAQSVGVRSVSLSLNWNASEAAPGTLSAQALGNLSIANDYYPPRNVQLALSLRPVDTGGLVVPADLSQTGLDDSTLASRFTLFVEAVMAQIPDITLTSVMLGNEVDLGLRGDVARIAQYRVLFEAAASSFHRTHPGIPVGVSTTVASTNGAEPLASALVALNTTSDAVMLTYYPLNPDFTVQAPMVVPTDLAVAFALYPSQKVFLMEAGYPSSEVTGSSQSAQASFVHEVFSAWNAHAAAMPYVSFLRLHDESQADAEAYGITNPTFIEYLRSLGLRTQPGGGTDKEALEALRQEAASL